MTDKEVEAAYSERAAEYIAGFGSMESTHPADRKLIADWVAPLVGPVLDVGCGPGQWTKFLADQGAVVEGIDLVPSFIEQAKTRFPGIPFRVAFLTLSRLHTHGRWKISPECLQRPALRRLPMRVGLTMVIGRTPQSAHA